MLVKGTNNLWKVCGVIDGFNVLLRKISYGVEKTVDDSMSAILFRTTPKVDLPHYSYIFRNMDTLGEKMKNV